jgi:hypothetical protein
VRAQCGCGDEECELFADVLAALEQAPTHKVEVAETILIKARFALMTSCDLTDPKNESFAIVDSYMHDALQILIGANKDRPENWKVKK